MSWLRGRGRPPPLSCSESCSLERTARTDRPDCGSSHSIRKRLAIFPCKTACSLCQRLSRPTHYVLVCYYEFGRLFVRGSRIARRHAGEGRRRVTQWILTRTIERILCLQHVSMKLQNFLHLSLSAVVSLTGLVGRLLEVREEVDCGKNAMHQLICSRAQAARLIVAVELAALLLLTSSSRLLSSRRLFLLGRWSSAFGPR